MAAAGTGASSPEMNFFVNVDDRGTAKRTSRNMETLFSTIQKGNVMGGGKGVIPQVGFGGGAALINQNKKVKDSTEGLFSSFEKQKEAGKNMNPYPEHISGAGQLTKGINQTAVAFRGFRMELLSVMFFGMALNKVFGDHVQRVNDMIGVTAMWNAAAEDMLLEVMLPLGDAQIALADGLMNLPQPMKDVVGATMLMVTVGGQLLMSFGMIGLGLDGMTTAFPRLGKLIKPVTTKMSNMWNVLAKFAGKAFTTTLSFAKRGWTSMASSLTKLGGFWGKKKGTTVAFGSKGWAGPGGIGGILTKLKNSKTFKVTVMFAIGILAAEGGRLLGEALNKNVVEPIFGTRVPMADTYKNLKNLPSWATGLPGIMQLGQIFQLGQLGSQSDWTSQGFDDFIIRPGQSPMRINPSDTVVGTKGGGMGQNFTNNINIDAVIKSDYDVRDLGGRIAEIQQNELSSRSLS